MATTHYYVDTASTTGGDGTTSATSGTNRAYNNLQAALTARATALTTGNFVVIHCAASGGAKDSNTGSDLDFTGWSSVVGGYLTIQVDSGNRHAGVYDTTKYRLEGGFGSVFNHPPQYTRIIGMQAINTSDDLNLCIFNANGIAGQGCQFLYNIGRFSDKNFTYGTLHFVELVTDNTGDPVIIANNLFYGGVGTHGRAGSTGIDGANTKAIVYSNTIIGFGAANDSTSSCIPDGYSKITAINNLVSGYSHFGSPNGTGTDYNATDLAAASGKTHDRVSQTFTFVDAVGTPKNYQLASGDTGAKGYGKDLSSDGTFPITDDITGTTRTTPWDIGAFIAAIPSGDVATGTAGEEEGASGAAGETIAVTGTAGSEAGASGAAGERIAVAGTAGEEEAAAGSAGSPVTGTAGEEEGAAGAAGERIAVSGAAGSEAGASGTAGEQLGVAGTGGEEEGASGAAGERIAVAGTGGEEEGTAGSAGERIAAAGSGGEEEGAAGTAGTTGGPTTFGSGAQEEGAQGSAGETIPIAGAGAEEESATGAAGERIAVSGSATSEAGAAGAAGERITAAGTGAEEEGASAVAGENISAAGTAAQEESAHGTAGQTIPGAAKALRVVVIMSDRYVARTFVSSRYRATVIISS